MLFAIRESHFGYSACYKELSHYFQAHTVVVFTQIPLQSLFRRFDYTRRVAKWGTILGAFDIKYMPCTAIKGQVLTDLVAEFTEYPAMFGTKEEKLGEVQVLTISAHKHPTWNLYVDGVAN